MTVILQNKVFLVGCLSYLLGGYIRFSSETKKNNKTRDKIILTQCNKGELCRNPTYAAVVATPNPATAPVPIPAPAPQQPWHYPAEQQSNSNKSNSNHQGNPPKPLAGIPPATNAS